MTTPAEMTLSEFARHLGQKGSWVTQLKQTGRLVLTDNGKRVRVAESIERIEATRDPAKQAVADRHAAARAEKAEPQAQVPAAATGAEQIGNTYQAARAVKEKYNAMQAKLEYERAIGKLLEAGAVAGALSNAATTLRARLEALPDLAAPQLAAETDEGRCRALLGDMIEHALQELSDAFKRATEAPHAQPGEPFPA